MRYVLYNSNRTWGMGLACMNYAIVHRVCIYAIGYGVILIGYKHGTLCVCGGRDA